MNTDDLTRYLILPDKSVRQAMKQLDENDEKILFVADSDKNLIGALTDGDVRRWILAEGALEASIDQACNKKPFFATTETSQEQIEQTMLEEELRCIPVLKETKQIDRLVFGKKLSKDVVANSRKHINVPVVIMAGGKGTRLEPFTKVLPKPLVPLGEKTIIETIIDRFRDYAVSDFYLSVNHKSSIIRAFFEELNPEYCVHYIDENVPLGTAGSLRYLKNIITETFFVSNCDILIEADYHEVLQHHFEKKNDITVVAALRNHNIPYGICEIQNGGTLLAINEKPEYSFLVNTGMYILNANTIDLIPRDTFFHITDLIESVKRRGGKVGVFPVSEKSWIDIGQWEEYRSALRQLEIH